ncbi:hypothetical protein FB562_2220 [Homoserinimonas aerilata]|uniref:Uncharacterized protein n=2 Tax=Homoserinimonas aerilata TaxID=1162970 RepID=A0A542YF29_9MICO|nr:hypothetical protein FB562_2220 [Homoserinimonas aerilata]
MTTHKKERTEMAEKHTESGPGSFAAVLATIRPKTDIELAEKLSKLIEDVKVTGKKGTLTVKFEVKPVDGGGQAVIVNDAIAVRAPEKNREGSMAFIGENNRLQRTDPSAMPLFDDDIREHVDPGTGEIKEAPKA